VLKSCMYCHVHTGSTNTVLTLALALALTLTLALARALVFFPLPPWLWSSLQTSMWLVEGKL
jgi:hypothetical protein